MLAWSPFVLGWSAIAVGLVFCGWGLCVAVAGVALAPRLAAKLGERHAAAAAVFGYAVLMLVLAVPSKPVLVAGIIVSGLVSGLLNTLFTGTAMSISDAPRPVASAGYNFCRWLGGAVAATLVGHVAEWFGSPQAPFVASAVLCVVAGALLSLREKQADPHDGPEGSRARRRRVLTLRSGSSTPAVHLNVWNGWFWELTVRFVPELPPWRRRARPPAPAAAQPTRAAAPRSPANTAAATRAPTPRPTSPGTSTSATS